MTQRSILLALIVASLGMAAGAQQRPPVMQTAAFEWEALPAKRVAAGAAFRQFFHGPTATLGELELHATTLAPGRKSYARVNHPNEALVIVKEGVVKVLVAGEWKRLGPGSVVYYGTHQVHGVKNVGTTPATYHVVSWVPAREAREQRR